MNRTFYFVPLCLVVFTQAIVAQTVTLRGTVEHIDTGEPARGTLHKTDRIAPSVGYMLSNKEVVVNRDGTWEMHNLKPATVYLRLVPTRATQFMVNGVLEVDLTDPKILEEGLKIYVDDGCAIRGTLTDQNGEPLAGSWVSISPSPWYQSMVVTNRVGRFRFHFRERTGIVYTVSAGGNRVKVGPLEDGEIFKDVVLWRSVTPPKNLNPPREQLVYRTLKGRLIDSTGAPVPNASVEAQPYEGSATTAADGSFEMSHSRTDSIRFVVKVRDQYRLGVKHIEATLVSDAVLDLSGEPVAEPVTLIIEPIPYFEGLVRDPDGNRLYPEVTMFTGSRDGRKSVRFTEQGRFTEIRMDKTPFIVLFTLPGYQARVLEPGRDFTLPVRDLEVVMQRGPFTFDQPVFTAITGRPAIQSEVDALIDGKLIRQRERRFIQEAAAPPLTDSRSVPAMPTHRDTYSAKIVDWRGEPVQRLYATAAFTGTEHNYDGRDTDRAMVFPDENDTRRVLESATGEYTVRADDLIWMSGSVQYLVKRQPLEESEPAAISLPRSDAYGGFAVYAVDELGEAVESRFLAPESFLYGQIYYTHDSLPRTDAAGRVRVEQLPPGEYVYFLGDPALPHSQQDSRASIFNVRIRPGEIVEKNVVVYMAETQILPERIRALHGAVWRLDKFEEAMNLLDADERTELIEYAANRLDEMPARESSMWRNVPVFARIGQVEESREVGKALRSFFLRAQAPMSGAPHMQGRLTEVGEAIAALGGNGAVSFFRNVAANSDKPTHARVQAVIGLGVIGSPQAVRAYKRLRDAVYERVEGPEPLVNPTHAEKIAEAFHMVFEWIPETEFYRNSKFPEISLDRVWIDENFTEGRLDVGDALHGGTRIEFRRFDSEWLVVHVGGTMIS